MSVEQPSPPEAVDAVRADVRIEADRFTRGETGGASDAQGGAFVVNPAELEALIKGWEVLQAGIERNDAALAEAARNAQHPMAADAVSGDVAIRLNGAITTALVGNMEMREYANRYLEALRAMSPRYRNTDDSAASGLRDGS
ncbi:hypothetical protein L6E12_05760 [Actinokineospora sp. PR83]|uniref:hypothetical protein n=1 Tax=Actinokineospora sp. PR83 TaxID=2884908 RepID=UPI001F21BE41|nr:hypothetical protein [Actinokineospora sp. PR83]MCG8915297.1 hypothetical protein [Actinokineospora sp. PR83]